MIGTLLNDELREIDLDLAALEVLCGYRGQLGAQLIADSGPSQVVNRLALQHRCHGVAQHYLGATKLGLVGGGLDLERDSRDQVIAPARSSRIHDHACTDDVN